MFSAWGLSWGFAWGDSWGIAPQLGGASFTGTIMSVGRIMGRRGGGG